jgi:hypothetical protein
MKAEKIKWTELDYQGDNDNLQFGLEILDEQGYNFDCHWFENDEKRQKFIIENNIQTN